MCPRGKALKWPPEAAGFLNLQRDEKHNSQLQKPIHCTGHYSSFKYQGGGGMEGGGGTCQLPSALISVGPQAQMEEAGKFASASTETEIIIEQNQLSIKYVYLFFPSIKKRGLGTTGE